MWSCLIGMAPMILYRANLDQMVAQRYLAAKNLTEAKRIVYVGTILTSTMFILTAGIGWSLIYWFRDCDPQLRGSIANTDQVK